MPIYNNIFADIGDEQSIEQSLSTFSSHMNNIVAIIEKAEEHGVTIIATSALLTSTLKEQRKLENALREKGLRSKYITMVGGAPCSARWAKRIGADLYTEDAVEAAQKALEILNGKAR